MSEATDKVSAWAEKIGEYRALEWERLPEIYLYMDQVLTYMDKQLHLFERTEDSSLLTSSMINNYVKDGVLPRPEQKKYSKEHLALLTVICMLKQVLSIPDISMLLKQLRLDAPTDQVYARFCEAQYSALREVSQRVAEHAPHGEAELTRLAIELSAEANARRAAAERILVELSVEQRRKPETAKDKEKNKDREKEKPERI